MKKGQVTTIIIIGILLVAAVFFLLYLRGVFTFISPGFDLDEELQAINNHISSCLSSVSEQEAVEIGKRGGYLTSLEGSTRLFNDTEISYLCYNIPDSKTCRNRLLLKEDIEANLNYGIKTLLATCINLDEFSSNRYTIESEDSWDVSTIIGENNIIVSLSYPLKIVSSQSSQELSNEKYNAYLNYPLGNLYRVANNIIKEESIIGEFDALPYMLENPQIKIIKLRPYPDKVYIVKRVDSPFIFQFAIQGD